MMAVQQRPLLPVLIRHSFSRLFDNEISGSVTGGMAANAIQALAIIAVPGAFYSLYSILHYSFGMQSYRTWIGVTDRYLFLCYSMVVIGFAMAVEWNAFFPDRQDFFILTPLPVPKHSLFLAKFTALCMFLIAAAFMTNLCSTVIYPMASAPGSNLPEVLRVASAHLITMLASSTFVVFSLASLHGILVAFTRGTTYKRLSALFQGLAFTVLSMLLLFLPFLSFALKNLIQHQSTTLFYLPPCWFLGLYEVLLPGEAKPIFHQLARFGTAAVVLVFCVYVITYLIACDRYSRIMAGDECAPQRVTTKWLNRIRIPLYGSLLQNPAERATYEFISKILWRTPQRRAFLAPHAGLAAAFALLRAFDLDVRAGKLFLIHSHSGLFSIPLILSFLLLTGIRAAFAFPSELRANWIFQLSGTRIRKNCLSGTRKWLVGNIILPIFVIYGVCDLIQCDLWTAAFHLCFGILISLGLLEAMFWSYASVPFTTSYSPPRFNFALGLVLYCFGFALFSYKTASWADDLSRYRLHASSLVIALSLALWFAHKQSSNRLSEQQSLFFGERGQDTVQALNLTPGAS